MSVVLRCPNCGTTRANSGECEACREAQVRYFCTNHSPGVWLDTATCSQCGARFGEPARKPSVSASARPARPERPRSPSPAPAATAARPRAPASPPPARRPAATAVRPRRAVDEREPDISMPARHYEERELGTSSLAGWQRLLQAALRARYMPSTRVARARHERPPVGRGAGGCLVRLLLGMVLVVIALVSAVFFFGRALVGF